MSNKDRSRLVVRRLSRETLGVAVRLGGGCRAGRRVMRLVSRLARRGVSRDFKVFPPFCASYKQGVRVNGGIFVGTKYGFRSRNNVCVRSKILVKRGTMLTAVGRVRSPRGETNVVFRPVRVRGGM